MDKVSPETVVVKDTKFGKGIFTTANLSKKTILFKITGKPITFEDTLQLGDNECYSLQIGMNKYIIPNYPFHLSNHSCVPNCGINRKMEFITLRDVEAGEELCWDYSTSMMEKHWVMQCDCGNQECRHLIQDFDLLPVHIQEKYLQMKIVLPYIVEELYGLPKIGKAEQIALYAINK